MKKLPILLFSILISFNSYGGWSEIGESYGETWYINKIKEHKGYIYFWRLTDYLKPNEDGMMSVKAYYQGDCGINKNKLLSFIDYRQPMGNGESETFNPTNSEWEYPVPESIAWATLDWACNYKPSIDISSKPEDEIRDYEDMIDETRVELCNIASIDFFDAIALGEEGLKTLGVRIEELQKGIENELESLPMAERMEAARALLNILPLIEQIQSGDLSGCVDILSKSDDENANENESIAAELRKIRAIQLKEIERQKWKDWGFGPECYNSEYKSTYRCTPPGGWL